MKNKDTNIKELTKAFALQIIDIYRYLTNVAVPKEHVLSKQILRSGTSIGANVREAINAQTKADFATKMNIALKEASETEYWLELLFEAKFLSVEQYGYLMRDCKSINRILNAIVKTTFDNIANDKN